MLSRSMELVFALFVGRPRAEALVGDIEEAAARNGGRWPVLAYLGALISVSWRFVAGYLLASIFGGYVCSALSSRFWASLNEHSATAFQQSWGSTLSVVAGLLALTALYSAMHFGPRDLLTKTAAAFALYGAVMVSVWWRSTLVALLGTTAVVLIAQLLRSSKGRRSLGALALMVGFQFAFWPLALGLVLGAMKQLRMIGPSPLLLLTPLYMVLVGVLCGCCAWLHRWMLDARLRTRA